MGVRMRGGASWGRAALLGAVLTAGLTGVAGAGSYRVKAGDTLSGIAVRTGVSVAALRAANPRLKSSDAVQAGWVLTVPTSSAPRAAAAPVKAGTYTVRAGDTLSGIAVRTGVSVASLRAANPRLKTADAVQAGWVLTVPISSAPRAAAPVKAGTYTVRDGENLTVIARRFGLSVTQLVNANPQYRGGKAMWAGAKLIIPPRTATASRAVTVRVTGSRPGRWAWPLPGYHAISSDYGERVLDEGPEMHYGVDIVAPHGTPVRAARSGRVLESRADFERGWGWTVVLEHPDGWITRYAHLSATLVKPGELVVQGQPVGRVGNTGRSTGTHLHFGTYLRWDPRDPLSLY
ncbi:LysM peptidoglycan-binding domain-containing protein [Deinococcus grandis]|uniref:LysM peptidoglycan-binding domain-containing protein n=1 Tax=Deinococcus grandis TaxID=57498 RepID=UPI0009F8CED1|nr:M23 family metallopeptidase [Deinococcus grandis]BBN93306.1 cell wall glycyl-glycine endopeptidase [Deinococcus grandis]